MLFYKPGHWCSDILHSRALKKFCIQNMQSCSLCNCLGLTGFAYSICAPYSSLCRNPSNGLPQPMIVHSRLRTTLWHMSWPCQHSCMYGMLSLTFPTYTHAAGHTQALLESVTAVERCNLAFEEVTWNARHSFFLWGVPFPQCHCTALVSQYCLSCQPAWVTWKSMGLFSRLLHHSGKKTSYCAPCLGGLFLNVSEWVEVLNRTVYGLSDKPAVYHPSHQWSHPQSGPLVCVPPSSL